jgi:hypothetical protein
VEDAAVVGGLVLAGRGFFFQHGNVRVGVLAQELSRGGEAHNAAADDQCGWDFQLAPPCTEAIREKGFWKDRWMSRFKNRLAGGSFPNPRPAVKPDNFKQVPWLTVPSMAMSSRLPQWR